jgi:hypothetical protein
MLNKTTFEKNISGIKRKIINMGFLNDAVPKTWEDQDQGTYLIDCGSIIEIRIDNDEDSDNPFVDFIEKE